MNAIFLYEQRYINIEELALVLWDFSPSLIYEVGEKCFAFYCNLANQSERVINGNNISGLFYIRKYGSDHDGNDEWFCE